MKGKCVYVYRGEIEAAHYMTGVSSESGVHGHTWRIHVHVKEVEDLDKFRRDMEAILSRFDGEMLGDVGPRELAEKIFELASVLYPVVKVVVYMGRHLGVQVKGNE